MLRPSENELVPTDEPQILRRSQSQAYGSVSKPKSEEAPTLIEFPGLAQSPAPQWRTELSRRVREMQERRKREAAAAAASDPGSANVPASQLELVPKVPAPRINPVVRNALRRLERAGRVEQPAQAVLTPEPRPTSHPTAAVEALQTETADSSAAEENTLCPEIETVPQSANDSDCAPVRELKLVLAPEPVVRARPVRTITDEVEDAALSYLENYLSYPALPNDAHPRQAGLGARIIAGLLDFVFTAFLAAPFAAGIELANGNWNDPRLRFLMAGVTLAVLIVYPTVSTALTGQTWGMRLLSIRAIDARTGLIPAGGQAAKRTLGYLFSLATLGVGLLYALFDHDGRTIHDRFSKTVVVRD